jgi:hypothetical protein
MHTLGVRRRVLKREKKKTMLYNFKIKTTSKILFFFDDTQSYKNPTSQGRFDSLRLWGLLAEQKSDEDNGEGP